MRVEGPDNDIAVASRIRLARNIAGTPFPAVASDDQLKAVKHLLRSVAQRSSAFGEWKYAELKSFSPLHRQMLVERHVISPYHAEHAERGALIQSSDGTVSIMVNEEDHVRLQVIYPGFQLSEAWEFADGIDDFLESELDYAFSEKRGYLTACPTNVGTGLRASVMLHLPALTYSDHIKKVVAAVGKFGLAVRGLYGEGSDVLGNLYQLSNQITLGQSEQEIISHLQDVTRQIIRQERKSRELAMESRIKLEDRLFRSYGILANARSISSHEAMERLSDVRLGIDLGLIKGIDAGILQELMVGIRPAHLQESAGKDMSADERDVYRASLIRERLKVGA